MTINKQFSTQNMKWQKKKSQYRIKGKTSIFCLNKHYMIYYQSIKSIDRLFCNLD